ncbi:DUF305 domain-containing protein [Maritimibacter dapengensis]|uniref:DUF305 domain-containing protein n=1 Tax=Maritimibacter dapengensis TaxID=2836868 RepID=A0ABS6T5F6_9RHOB|nr:DUF305 domain-containing protein [Maritimibacter dapengensis]MBV7379781.1 DUF305 domain-containing protein [Maritimibacter dapengensis]
MTYGKFAAMIATSTLVMFGLMYLNTYASPDIFFSETRAYMAILMGATMAFVMMAFMAKMYPSRGVNIAIFTGSIVLFALSLWLVRSQATVSGVSYMRAMIPHHSIAIMTSTRADIEDARAAKLAEDISAAQNKEISEMRYMIASIREDGRVESVYRDPEPEVGSVNDALSTVRLAGLDPAPLTEAEAAAALEETPTCNFRREPSEEPILWATEDGDKAAIRLNGYFIALEGENGSYSTERMQIDLTALGDEADFRANSELVWSLEPGPTAGYRGFSDC